MNNLIIKSTNNKDLNLEKIGLIYNEEHLDSLSHAKKIELFFQKNNYNAIKQGFSPSEKPINTEFRQDFSFVIVVGGDGTLLSAARFYAKLDTPVLGINSGRLGFLAQVKPQNIEEGLQKILKGKFSIEERLMLEATDEKEHSEFLFPALNDIVIKGGTLSRPARLYLYINDKHVCDYLADGLIISTPTGSTAYTLSAGGPVLVPELDAFVIVPICPHSLTTRPLVIPANEQIKVKASTNHGSTYLTADGQEIAELKNLESIYIGQHSKKAKLIRIEKENNGFYSILREKLHWGLSPRG